MTWLTDPVMRACNGCRKRKIKCDAATTNTWPCSACTRLKLVCVPPTIGQDGDFINEGMEPPQEVGSSSTSEASHHAFPVPPTYRDPNQALMGTMPSYDGMGMYSQFVHAPPNQPGMYNDMRSSPVVMPHQSYPQQPQVFPGPQPPHLATPERGVFPENDKSTADNLSDVLGELKIDETGIGMIFFFVSVLQIAGYPCSNTVGQHHIFGGKGRIAPNQRRLSRTKWKNACPLSARGRAQRFESPPN